MWIRGLFETVCFPRLQQLQFQTSGVADYLHLRLVHPMGKYHPNKEVSDAMEYAVGLGWTIVPGGNHAYAMLRCPQGDRTGCQVAVFHTPKNPGNHARRVIRDINACDCGYKHEGDGE